MPNLPTALLGAAAATHAVEAIGVRDVRKRFGATTVLDGVNLDVPAGSLVALLGPSGCGKTTLLRAIAGLEQPDDGIITLGTRLLSAPRAFVAPERRRIGMVFQDWALFPHLSVGRNVGFGLDRRERRSGRVEEALALVELTGLADRMPATLSGGQQQRVALARALANRPAALLLDEPFSNLDATLRTSIRDEVRALLTRLGLTALFVTHDQEEAFAIGDQVAVMIDGVIEQQGTPADIYETPATRNVAAFVGDANFLAGTGHGAWADTSIGAVPLVAIADGAVEVVVRPERIAVAPGDGAVIEGIEYYGHDAVYRVRTDGGEFLRSRVLANPRLGAGDRVALRYVGEPSRAYSDTRFGAGV
jgi:iron(III) transport system ATP-binding protein